MNTGAIIQNPRITEKASLVAEGRVYTFDISPRTNKQEVEKAIFTLYKVKPLKVRVLVRPIKKVFVRGKRGTQAGGKTALVYLKKGDKIDLI